MRSIFVNLPVADLDVSKGFFAALGFEVNPMFTDETAACMEITENISVMLLTRPTFEGFIVGAIADLAAGVEVLNGLTCGSREEVDELVAKALANGGSPWRDKMEMGPMYGHSFRDPDGHVWELMHMGDEPTPA